MGQIVLASQVVPERVEWLWPGYLPRGKIVLLDGDPGLGKSTLLCEIAARVTRGEELPGGRVNPPATVLMLSVEDGQRDTTVPRLIAAGADLDRVALRETYTNDDGEDTFPAFPGDIARLEQDILIHGAVVVIIDPIMRCIDGTVNSHNDQQLGRALMPLRRLAEQYGCTIILVRHLNKSSGQSAIQRGQGSMAFVGVARVALLMARDPDDRDRRVLTINKTNFQPGPSLSFHIGSGPLDAARIEWDGVSRHTADTVLTEAGADDEESLAVKEAIDFLVDTLAGADDFTMASREIERLAKEESIAPATLKKARGQMGIRRGTDWVQKAQGLGGQWHWILPPKYRPGASETGSYVHRNGHEPEADYTRGLFDGGN